MRLDQRRESLGLSVVECSKRVAALAKEAEEQLGPLVMGREAMFDYHRKLYERVLDEAEKEKANAQ